MKKNIFNLQNSIFEPSIIREITRTPDGAYYNYSFKSNNDLKYETKKGENQNSSLGQKSKFGRLYSTRELNINFAKFENHTFFDSAVSKTNIAFDRVINLFPFDQTRQDIENFKENSTGFEDYVLKSFPKNKGYLHFVGDSNQFISVKDMSGYLYSAESEKRTSNPVFSPLQKGLTVEFWLRVPAKTNDRQVLCQLIDTNRSGFSIALDTQTSTDKSNLRFTLISGSNSSTISSTIAKGRFVHLATTYDNKDKRTKLFIDGVQKVTSSILDFDSLEMRQANLLIGSGSSYDISGATFTPQSTFSGSMDEFRYYHGAKGRDAINLSYLSPTYKDDELNLDLIAYFKFNEPQGSYTGNDLVLDYSSHNLHSKITNYADIMRQTGSMDAVPLTKENIKDCHVLFADHVNVTDLNKSLLVTASIYDDYNPNLITRLIPQHYLLEGQQAEGFANSTGSLGNAYTGGNLPSTGKIGSNQLLISFLLIWAKYFDELKLYVDNLSNILHTSYDNFKGSSPNFYKLIAENKGIVLPNIIDSEVNYLKFNQAEGINNLNTNSSLSLNDFQNEIWKRLLINIKSIQKEKGTKRSLQSLMNIFGLDFERYFEFKEYGGVKSHYLEGLRVKEKKLIRLLDFSGSAASRSHNDMIDLNAQGFSAGSSGKVTAPYLISPFLSASRIETGFPELALGSPGRATLEFTSTTAADYNRDEIAITDTNGTTIIYEFNVTAGSAMATGVISGSNSEGRRVVRVSLHGLSGVSNYAAELRSAIIGATGHNGMIGTSISSGEITLTNKRDGLESGNEGITYDSFHGADPVTVSGFSGGTGVFFKSKSPHGESANTSDGLLTSGSFTYEGTYRFLGNVKHHKTQSLVRLVTTGTQSPASTTGGLLANLVAINDKENTKLKLYVRQFVSTVAHPVFETQILSASLFDGFPWYVSFGRIRNDDKVFYGEDNIKSTPSSSYFVRCGRIDGSDREVYFSTASFYLPPASTPSYFNTRNDANNASGSFIIIGSQSIDKIAAGGRFLNYASVVDTARESNFSGQVGFIRFHSRALTEKEAREKMRNPFSLATKDPKTNYNHNLVVTDSFGRMRVNASVARQLTTASNTEGQIKIFDNSQNNFHLTAKMFEPSKQVIKPDQITISVLSTNFDERVSSDKVRVRSYQLKENLDKSLYAKSAPIYDIPNEDVPPSDRRISVDMSSVKGLNEDINKMFDSLEIFEESYIDLEKIRNVYFEDLLHKIDLESNTKFFTWFDNSFTDLISSLIPLETVFLGVNYVIEPHNLERNRLRYYFNKQYMIAEDKTINVDSAGTIFG